MSNIRVFYYIGLIFFLSTFVFATVQKIILFNNNIFSEAVYENGYAYVVKEEKVTEEKYKAYSDMLVKEGSSIYILHNNESEFAYIFSFNRMLNQELFNLIFIVMFVLLLREKRA